MPADDSLWDDDDPAPAPRGGDPAPRAAREPTARDKAIFGVPIEVTVSVGKARPMISEVVALRRDSVLPLDSRIDDPVEIFVGNQLVARGELQELEDESGRLAVRLTEIMDLGVGG